MSADAPRRPHGGAAAPPSGTPPSGAPRPGSPSASRDAMAQLLASHWQRNLPLMRERFDLLAAFAASLGDGSSTPALREEATSTAHKLAGSLGMFGFPQGTVIARELELLLDSPRPAKPAAVTRLVEKLHAEVPLTS